eukprot:NODE_5314_length_1032_cov_23.238724_g4747_i0.p1 GENE.NODE_5314_length_1032_cov_23.238724_g4747_i0~~NODE_5314_length_1032_cov_23.238724_g4747_i0.p1  ORF type:complete len:263 (-),score=59.27 NODE_5314_length_1032_cov_23.238724_g4747_i0:244-921(-)
MLASFGLIVPTVAKYIPYATTATDLNLSRGVSICLLLCYMCYIFFQLRTHGWLFEDVEPEEGVEVGEEEEPQMSRELGIIGLAICTVLICFESEFLVGTLEETSVKWGLSKAFIGVILVPIVGNVAEHATAVLMAYRNKMDVAIGVAVGSSIQISLCVIPVLVLMSWAIGHDLDLNFHPFPTTVMTISVLTTMALVQNGTAHWLAGVLFLSAYVMIALSFLLVAY